MKFSKLAMGAAIALAYGNAYAFHSGGVAECDGCHTMHNSDGGAAMAPASSGLAQYQAGPYLLQGNTQSEACLNCHQHAGDTGPGGYHISTAPADMTTAGDAANTLAVPLQMTPGGDFGWIRANVPFLVRGSGNTNFGEGRGHNIVAPGYGYAAVTGVAPGSTFNYPAANLQCSSCHDPHGRFRVLNPSAADVQVTTGAPIAASGSYGNPIPSTGTALGVYRLLGGSGYYPKSMGPTFAFTAPAPVATAPSNYNRSEAASETIVAYGKGMAEYCANCHDRMLMNGYVSGTAMLRHPAGNGAPLGATISANYVAYVSSGVLTGVAPNYTSLVPFEIGSADSIANKAFSGIAATKGALGPTAGPTSNVSCLSCHRAHASGFQSMLRFAHENEFMTIGSAGVAVFDTSTTEGKINRGFASAAAQASQYYGRPATFFGQYNRLMCNKCHAKD